MTLRHKQIIISILAIIFLASLVLVQYQEVQRKEREGQRRPTVHVIPASSKSCVECHRQQTPGIIAHWEGSTHAIKGVGCVECHQAEADDADAFNHYGALIATVVTPRDCSRCHQQETAEFERSHHAKGGNILASLDNFLAETVEGSRVNFNPHGPTPGKTFDKVNGMASAQSGCQQCHGSKVGLQTSDGAVITVDDLKPDAQGKPTNKAVLGKIMKNNEGRPILHASTWPNTGIGRINPDGSEGSCAACHSRHSFSAAQARHPNTCGKGHMGPDHTQKEIYEESKQRPLYIVRRTRNVEPRDEPRAPAPVAPGPSS